MKKTRAPDLTPEVIAQVVDLIDGWTGTLTWNALVQKVAELTSIEYSRYTFLERPSIATPFSLRKEALRGKGAPKLHLPRDERVRGALAQADRYRSKVERLEAENQLLLEQFIVWATNAERKGVTIAMLNAPLLKPSRDRSKGEV